MPLPSLKTRQNILKSLAAFLLAVFVLGLLPRGSYALSADKSGDRVTGTVTEYTLPPDKLAKSAALRKTRWIEFVVDSVYGLALLLLFLYARWTVAFRDLAERVSRSLFAQAWIFVPLFVITLSVLDLPPEMYGHHISREYGLSVQGWPSWFADWGKALALEVFIGTLLLWLMYLIIRKSPRLCWFYFWMVALAVMVFMVFISPVVLEPMFNKFVPLDSTNPALVTKIEEVVHRAGMNIPRSRMFEMKASEKTNELNAYVTGYGATKRVVVWDTTEQKMTTPQTLFVFGHEMGHYVLGHIWKGMVFAGGLMLVLFYLGYRLSVWLIRGNGLRWGILNLGDWASLPVLILVISVLSFFSEPIDNAFSRMVEHHADIYGLEVIHGIVPDSNQAAAQAFQVLGENSLDYPYPNRFLVWWFDNHPSVPDRVRFAVDYDPWAKGESPQFVK
ncbi:MAG TPA: M48 family metallopeptidase [Terriglobales bacterium]|nr:M48 family metallopeptidase [Terriglobales bacterium]